MIVFPRSSYICNLGYCSLHSYLNRQYNILHGYEQRTFKQIPKVNFLFKKKKNSRAINEKKKLNQIIIFYQIIFIICERILQLCDCQEDNSPAEIEFTISSSPFTQRFISHVLEKLKQQEVKMKHSWTDSSLDLSYLSENANNFFFFINYCRFYF